MRYFLVLSSLIALFFTLSSPSCSDQNVPFSSSEDNTLVEKNKGKKYSASWSTFNRLVEKERYTDAQQIVTEIYANAWRTKNHPEQLRCLSAELLLLGKKSEDVVLDQYQLLTSYEARSAYPLKNIIRLEKIQFLRDNYVGWGAKSEDEQETDIRLWNKERTKKEMIRLGELALNDHTDALKNTRLLDYKIAFENTTYEASLFPTLYHYVGMRIIQFYDNNTFSSKWNLTDSEKERLLMNYVDFSKLDLNQLVLEQMDGKPILDLYQSVIRFSMEEKEIYAAEWFNLYRLTEGGSYRNSFNSSKYWQGIARLGEQSSYKPIRVEVDRMILERDFTLFQEQNVKTKAEYEVFLSRVATHEKERALFKYLPSTKSIKETILQQKIEIEVADQNVVGRPILALLTARNVSDFSYSIYAKKDRPIVDVLKDKPLRTVKIVVPFSDDYQAHSMEFFIDSLAKGDYYLVIDKENASNFVSFIVTDYSVSAIGQRLYFTDFVSGLPIQQKQVTFYKKQWNKETKDYEKVNAEQAITDENGSVKQFQQLFEFKGLMQDAPAGSYYYNRSSDDADKAMVELDIYTDRGIYRPGQKVFFKTVFKVYNSALKGKVLPFEKATVILRDANGQEVSKKEITSNEFGSAEGYFELPKGGLLGRFSLTVKLGKNEKSVYFSVDEYKRPKILMDWQKATKPFKMDQEEQVVGVLKTYSGVPLANRLVQYSVSETRYYYYRVDQPDVNVPEISYSGSVITDASGHFIIPIHAIEIGERQTIDYAIYAEVIDVGGEYVSGEYGLSLSKNDFSIQIDSKSVWDGAQASFKVETVSANGVEVSASGSYTIFQLVDKRKSPFTRMWNRPTESLISEATFNKWYPYLAYAGKESTVDTVKVIEGQWSTGGNNFVSLKDLSTGDYLVVATATDSQGHKINKSNSVRIDKSDKHLHSALYLQTHLISKTSVGSVLQVQVNSVLVNAPVLIEFYDAERLLFANTLLLQGNQGVLNYTIPDLSSGSLEIRASFVQNGQLFSARTNYIPEKAIPALMVEWSSFRDRIQPNGKEQWRLKVLDKAGNPVKAEVLVAMYDKSLDKFANHFYTWHKSYDANDVPPRVINYGVDQLYWNSPHTYFIGYKALLDFMPRLIYCSESQYGLLSREGNFNSIMKLGSVMNDEVLVEYSSMEANEEEEISVPQESESDKQVVKSDKVRENLNETAFFLPQLETNSNGEVSFVFSAPEALTTWRVYGLAHTKDLGSVIFERNTITQKDLMVEVLVPRFVREGDALTISARISNTTTSVLKANVELELFDLVSKQRLNVPFEVRDVIKAISVPSNGSEQVEWWIKVPYQLSNVGVRVIAKSGSLSDGEQMVIPILSNKTMVTSALPFVLDQFGEKVIDYSIILPKGDVSQLKVQLDYVQNPLWHVLMAIPDMDVKQEKQTVPLSNRLVALAALDQILKKSPGIVSVINEWKKAGADALLSELNRNEELKAIILSETPWVLQAQSQEERKRYIAELLTSVDAVQEGQLIWDRLEKGISYDDKLQGWPWRIGMSCNVGISRTILSNLERVRQLNPTFYNAVIKQSVVSDVMNYVVAMKWKNFSRLKEDQKLKQDDIQLVYLTTCFPGDWSKYTSMLKILNQNALKDWSKRTLNEQVVVALIADAKKENLVKNEILTGVKQRVIKTTDRGFYWPAYKNYQGTNIGSVALQAAVIELLSMDSSVTELLQQAQLWLLLNKRSNDWGNDYSTTEAIYGLLKASDWSTQPIVDVIKQNGKTITVPKLEAGSGYFNIGLQSKAGKLTIDKKSNTPSFGTIFANYLVDVDKVEANQSGLKISKTLYKVTRDSSGKEIKTKLSDGAELKQGEKVYVELKLTVDQSMEFIQIKDYRASGLELLEQSSGYNYQNGLGTYKEVRDAAVTYSIEQLDRGVYTLGYEMSVSRKGDYSNGYVMVQSVFNPEMVSYGKGSRLTIK